jgi:hypothetical protein
MGSKTAPCSASPGDTTSPRADRIWDPFAALVAAVAADPDNAYNVDRYLWVLDEPGPRSCGWCATWFWPGESYCSPRCAARATEVRRRCRQHGVGEWGRAA